MIKINLLPIEKREREKTVKQNLGLLIVTLGIFVILLILIIVLLGVNATLKAQISAKDSSIASTKSSLEAYKDIQNQVIFIKDRLEATDKVPDSKTNLPAVLKSLAKNCPSTIILTSFQVNSKIKPTAKITGFTPSRFDAAKFRQALEDSKTFTDVILESSKKFGKDNIELVDFIITANLK